MNLQKQYLNDLIVSHGNLNLCHAVVGEMMCSHETSVQKWFVATPSLIATLILRFTIRYKATDATG